MTRSFVKTLAGIEKQFPDQHVHARLRRAGIRSISALSHAAQYKRSAAANLYIWLLGKCGGPRAEATLLAALRGDRRSLWMQASASLCIAGTRRAVPVLTRLVEHGGHPLRREASAYALGCVDSGSHGPMAIAALVRILRSADEPRVRAQAAESLVQLLRFRRGRRRMSAERALIAHLGDESPDVRFWCAYAVGELRVKAAVPALRRLASDRARVPGWWPVGTEARDALRCIAGGAWPDRLPRARN
jgi:HEAT repeat protein